MAEDGSTVNGVIEANTKDEAIVQLKSKYGVISSIEEVGSPIDIDLRIRGRHTADKTLALVSRQFAIIMGAGLPVVRTVQLVADQTDDKTMKQTLLDTADDVAAGYTLADSLMEHGHGLPSTFIETIRAGEQSGNLQEIFSRLADYYEKRARTRQKVTNSMIYPLFVIGVAIVVVIIIMTFAVPVFASTFSQLGENLPWITRAMIASSNFLAKYIILIIAIIVAIIVILKLIGRTPGGRMHFARRSLSRPIFGRINLMDGAGQFAGTMATMLAAGLPVTTAVAVTAKSMDNYRLQTALESTIVDLEAGKKLGDSIAKTEAFPELINEMTAMGEETGSLESTLKVVSDYYDNEVDTSTTRALSILEPVIIVVLAIFVVGILLSVYLPLFTMYNSI